jgi:hypothetical protein
MLTPGDCIGIGGSREGNVVSRTELTRVPALPKCWKEKAKPYSVASRCAKLIDEARSHSRDFSARPGKGAVASDQRQKLVEIVRSRTEPANRVERERAWIILAYLGRAFGLWCGATDGANLADGEALSGARSGNWKLGVVAALDDRARSRRPPRVHAACAAAADPATTAKARAWLVALACAKAGEVRLPA